MRIRVSRESFFMVILVAMVVFVGFSYKLLIPQPNITAVKYWDSMETQGNTTVYPSATEKQLQELNYCSITLDGENVTELPITSEPAITELPMENEIITEDIHS